MSRTRIIYDKDGNVKAEFRNGECVFHADEFLTVETHGVIPDIQPFVANTGEFITGRRAWREHLKRTDGIEMGASDLKAAEDAWKRKKEAFHEKLNKANGVVKASEGMAISDTSRIGPRNLSKLQTEMLNRLHGRPIPERKELIKLTLDAAKRYYKRG